jgi:hypothetical protein
MVFQDVFSRVLNDASSNPSIYTSIVPRKSALRQPCLDGDNPAQ